MAAIPHAAFNITGATGTQGALAPLQSYRAYIFPRGANASQDSTGTTITFDSAAIASRFSANNWVQVGTAVANIRRVTAVGGDSITVNTAVTVSENNRIFLIGNTQPTTSGGSATYTTPNTVIRTRGDDAADIVANSMLTSNVDGLAEFYAAPNMYDALIQDGDRGPAGYIADLEVGSVEGISALDAAYFGSTVTFSGNQVGISSSGAATFGATVTFLAGVSMNTTLVVGQTITGTTIIAIAIRSSNDPIINVKHPDYGAQGNNSANDTAAINAAIAEAELNFNDSTGAIVYFPKGTYIVDSTINVPNRVRLVGEGRRNSVIDAGSSSTAFAADTPLIRLGKNIATNSFGTCVEQMALDLRGVTGSIGVISSEIQEGSGLRDVVITNFMSYGVSFSGSGQQNWSLSDLEVYGASSATSAHGIAITSTSGKAVVRDATINGTSGVAAISSRAATCEFNNIHMEGWISGISTDGGSLIMNCGGHSTVNEVVRIFGGPVVCARVDLNGATWAIIDTLNGVSTTNGTLYILSNAGGVGEKRRFDAGGNLPSWLGGAMTLDSSLSLRGTSNSNLTQAASLTLPDGYFFGVSGTIGAGTSISNMTQTQGRQIVLWAAMGTMGFSVSNTLRVIGNSINVPVNGAVQAFCTGTTWFIFSPSS